MYHINQSNFENMAGTALSANPMVTNDLSMQVAAMLLI